MLVRPPSNVAIEVAMMSSFGSHPCFPSYWDSNLTAWIGSSYTHTSFGHRTIFAEFVRLKGSRDCSSVVVSPVSMLRLVDT